MGRLTIDLDEEVETKLRRYIGSTYLRTHGKLTEVVERAITEYCSQGLAMEQVRSIEPGKHVVLLTESKQLGRAVQLEFLNNGLARGCNCVYLAPEESAPTAADLVREMAERAVRVNTSWAGRVRVATLPQIVDADAAASQRAAEAVREGLNGFSPPYYVVSAAFPENGDPRPEIGAIYRQLSEVAQASVLCNHFLTPERKQDAGWFNRLTARHDASIFATQNRIMTVGLSKVE